MRRVRHYEYGGPEVLRLEDAPEPVPGPGELLVRVAAIGVTLPAVRRVRAGDPAALPAPVGGEVAGEVIGIGPAGDHRAGREIRIGDRIAGLSFTGSYAEVVTVPAALATPIPSWASDVLAVALVRSGQVALGVLAAAAPRPGESVLITGSASGVGHLLVQLAKLRGVHRVVAAASTPDGATRQGAEAAGSPGLPRAGSAAGRARSNDKAGFLRGVGADEVVGYADGSWGEPVDVVLDAVGGELLPHALAAVRAGGRLIFFNSGGGTVAAHELLAGAKTITGFTVARFAATQPDRYRENGDELWELARTGRLRPAVHAELPLAQAAEAHRIIESRENLGKVVLRP
ncbi:quinone oxidoreductase family protein [Paractinoplanes toevensis]|uniref:NAD(P)H quinone oxidoreductase n=1 Tax=Paractinoplanes toevensis TaxID=571911 RepID=A0A919TFZ6_9ACTN|nr:zinc-binding dehydrogenase [Actinoplanes toevensis]GIM94845.1 NAD(P)H quinone oxidoreductase [Actinoplanes toevensis]